jgi:peptidyl-prolyl cis-trans isomerase D
LHEDEFKREETVSARHVLKKIPPDADDAQKAAARAAIEKVKQRIDSGEDFAKVAEEESEDAGSAKSGGDLGAFGRGKMVAPFEEAAFALEVGKTSDIVESPFGFHIIQVYAREPGGVPPLEEVRESIASKLGEKAAADRAFDLAASDALELREGRTDMEKVASARGLELETTDMLAKGDIVTEVGANPAFVDAALELEEQGKTSDPVRVGDSYYILQLQERRESRVPELTEVRDKAERKYREEQARELAQRKASDLIATLESGKSLEEVATAEGLEVTETEAFGRRSGVVPGLGSVKGLQEVAFDVRKDGGVLPRPFVHEGKAYVFVRKSFVEADRAEFDESKEQFLVSARQRREQAAVGEFVRSLKERMSVYFDQQLLERYMQQ